MIIRQNQIKRLSNAYLIAKQVVIDKGYECEIIWQSLINQIPLTESFFLRETAWVILSSGMKETVIRSIFPSVSKAFLEWQSAKHIISSLDICKADALLVFNNTKKIEAILHITNYVVENKFEYVYNSFQNQGVEFLRKFPYMGPATSLHLAKNLGLQVAKPDRHLLRIANNFNFPDVDYLCSSISDYVGDDIAEVDLVLWRYATLDKNYLSFLDENCVL